MKKLTALLMALVMTVGMAVTAFAAYDGIDIDANKNAIALEGALLTPGETYEFPVKVSKDTVVGDLDSEALKNVKTEVRVTAGGSTIDSAKIVEVETGKYALVVKVKAGWPTAQTNSKIKVRLLDKTTAKELSAKEYSFKTGYAKMDDATINGLTAGETIMVDPAKPVITKDQLATIAKLNNYKAVTFSYGDWSYTVNVTDLGDVNLLSNNSAIKEIMSKYPSQEFKFVAFPAGTNFGVNGKVEIDVSSEHDDFNGKFFTYIYANGKLTKVDAKLDSDSSTLSFSTKQLARYVITNVEIKDAVVVPGSNNGGSKNPNTGANDFVGAAAALAVISLAAAGAVVLRKRG